MIVAPTVLTGTYNLVVNRDETNALRMGTVALRFGAYRREHIRRACGGKLCDISISRVINSSYIRTCGPDVSGPAQSVARGSLSRST